MQANDTKEALGSRGKRAFMLAALIVIVTFSWVLMLMYTNLPTLALVAIGLLSLLALSLATAWTAMAFPGRGKT